MPHTPFLKSFFGVKTSFSSFQSQTKKRKESAKNNKKNMSKRGLLVFRCFFKMILTSKRRVEHPFAGRNTQHAIGQSN